MKLRELISEVFKREKYEYDDQYYLRRGSTSLVDMHLPSTVHKRINVTNNDIIDYTGLPNHIEGDLWMGHNKLSNFEGADVTVDGYVDLTYNHYTDLKNIHKHFKQITGGLDLSDNDIKSHVLGLLLIKDLNYVDMSSTNSAPRHVASIINQYLPNERGNQAVMECQNMLIDAGYEEYAQL